MKKTLVLAEKPSVGRDIANAINCKHKKNGYIEGNKYIVTWALGHLVTLARPKDYDNKYEKWNMEDLPMLPKYFKLNVIPQTSKQYKVVKSLMHRSDVDEIIIATDAGREGELVARWIIEKSGVKKKIKRLWISSVTEKAIKQGFNSLKDGRQYNNLYASAVARSEADWLVGLNASRALTCQYNTSLSCGRVQTPTLNIIKKREDEIKSFVPKQFFGINIDCEGTIFKWQDNKSKDFKTFNEDKVDNILSNIKKNDLKVIDVISKVKKQYAPSLYNLTDLQRDANKIFNYSAKETLSIMQKLYEHHKILTYPRTDSKYISTDIIETLKDRISACGFGEYVSISNSILNKKIVTNKSFVDNSKVTDHHAIIPTEEPVFIDDLNNKELNIYELVIKRFLSVFYAAYKYEQITATAEINNEKFISKGKRVIDLGWKEVVNIGRNSNEDEITLGHISKGDNINISNVIKTKGLTQPPSRFNEGTLLEAMENPVKFMSSSKDLINTIHETGGLGTVATRADIIEKLYSSALIEKSGNNIRITNKGIQLLDLVPDEIKSPELTAKWEKKLTSISNGKLNKNQFINEMKDYTKSLVSTIKQSEKKFKHDNISGKKCPECGKFLLEITNKNGKRLVCQDRECGYKKNVYKSTNARCPKCHKRLNLYGEGENKTFICTCGHKEKISTFNARKQESGSKMSKKDVSKYMKQQNKKKTTNNAFADAFANFNFDD